MNKSESLKALLIRLELELKTLSFWSTTAPSPQALNSTMPFAYDTMTFEQWLQFIFIPKMTALIDANGPLPNQIGLRPMAEQVYASNRDRLMPLLRLLADIDALLTGKSTQEPS